MQLAPELHAQVETLSTRYGSPIRTTVMLPDGRFDPFVKSDRIGEVCMVIRRPSGHLLTARKTFYPRNAYRLLTGGIAHGEPIEAALRREVVEETSLAVDVRRFLAIIAYTAPVSVPDTGPPARADNLAHFYTFAFLLDEIDGTLAPQDPDEQIDAFREVLPEELPALATRLEQVPDETDPEIGGRWRSWGMFRAVVHRVVHTTLTTTMG
jgi:8-oxo-dGTP pyrophosphatase MutT (NUDIX family)